MAKAIDTPFIQVSTLEVPLYEQVELWLKGVIDSHFEHDERFFTERELINLLKVSQPTVRRAMHELVNRRVLRRRVGQGTFVQKFPVTRLVGLVAPYWRSPIFMQQINAFAEACEEFDCDLRMHYIREGESIRSMARSLNADPNLERMVLWGQSLEAAEILSDELGQRHFKTVSTFSFPSEFMGKSVGVDITAGVRIALDYLTGLGHERIVFIINEPDTLGTIKVRLKALRDEVEKRGLSSACRFLSCGSRLWSDSTKAAYDAMDEVMKMTPRPTVVVPISGIGAWAVLRFAAKHKLQVPEAFSVFSFADISGSEYLYPSLTALKVDWKAVALRALEKLWDDLPRADSGQAVIQPSLVIRESTGPARRSSKP
ncbi:substrate-binding domain-containing protein [Cerasicoccus frondis]|uniref:substrate-binding domain-containing protein n=1 Tax=Cerasicoccus frondis TaxID=490090 RepID=UPI0028527D1E|nr:substrate-binding domain-containing protein [Cerasicoccus frondis]